MGCAESRHYISVAIRSNSGAHGHGGKLVLAKAHALGEHDAEALEERGLRRIGLGHATQADLSVCRRWQDHIVRLDERELFEHGARGIAKPALLLPQLEGFPQHEGKEAHEDVSLDAIGALMPNGTDAQLILLDAECGFGLCELDEGFPQL